LKSRAVLADVAWRSARRRRLAGRPGTHRPRSRAPVVRPSPMRNRREKGCRSRRGGVPGARAGPLAQRLRVLEGETPEIEMVAPERQAPFGVFGRTGEAVDHGARGTPSATRISQRSSKASRVCPRAPDPARGPGDLRAKALRCAERGNARSSSRIRTPRCPPGGVAGPGQGQNRCDILRRVVGM